MGEEEGQKLSHQFPGDVITISHLPRPSGPTLHTVTGGIKSRKPRMPRIKMSRRQGRAVKKKSGRAQMRPGIRKNSRKLAK